MNKLFDKNATFISDVSRSSGRFWTFRTFPEVQGVFGKSRSFQKFRAFLLATDVSGLSGRFRKFRIRSFKSISF